MKENERKKEGEGKEERASMQKRRSINGMEKGVREQWRKRGASERGGEQGMETKGMGKGDKKDRKIEKERSKRNREAILLSSLLLIFH